MLLPRFSLRSILLLNVLFALVFVVAKFAIEGRAWALSVLMSILGAALLMAMFAAMFLGAYVFSVLYRRRRVAATESPFATDRLPPQVIPPRHVDN